MRPLILSAFMILAAGLGGCAKCDVPTWGWSSPFLLSACSSETPRR